MRLTLFILAAFASLITNAQGNLEQPALGGIVDYDPVLISFFFDADEIKLMVADYQNNGGTAVQNAAKGINKKTNSSFSSTQVELREEKPLKEHRVYEFNAPNYIRGYIILGSEHRKYFKTYELYEGSGVLLGHGSLTRKKNIRVPWSAEGNLNLMLYSNCGNSQSFQFSLSP